MENSQHIDEALIRRFSEGDRTAFPEIYKLFNRRLYYFACKITHNAAEAQDIASGTLATLLDPVRGFESLDKIKAFLYKTCKNKCLNYIRKLKREHEHQRELSALATDNEENVQAQIMRTEFLSEVYREIENLSPAYKKIFKMFYVEGLDNDEIARQLNISSNSVYSNKSRALEKLRNILLYKKLSY